MSKSARLDLVVRRELYELDSICARRFGCWERVIHDGLAVHWAISFISGSTRIQKSGDFLAEREIRKRIDLVNNVEQKRQKEAGGKRLARG